MEVKKLGDFKKGWFVGPFEPSILSTEDAEVAVKSYKAGDKEDIHYHKVATEVTVVISGKVKMNNLVLEQGDVVKVFPEEAVAFEALEDSVNVVVKVPAVLGDKYLM